MLIKYTQYLIKARSLNPSRGNRILSPPKCPDQQQHPLSLLFNRYWGSFLGAKKPRHFHPVPRLRLSGEYSSTQS